MASLGQCCGILCESACETIGSFWEDKAKNYGPGISGMLFGCGWWMWIDAVLCVDGHKPPAVQYFPGIIATIAMVLMTCINRETIQEYDPFDDDALFRTRFWLVVAYIMSFGAVVGGIWMLIQDYATKPGVDVWPGVAALCHIFLVLASGLFFFLSRSTS